MEGSSQRRLEKICVFCGSSPGSSSDFAEAATELGYAMAERNIKLIYGGGDLGLMGCVSRAAGNGGSEVLGIIPQTLANLAGKTNGEVRVVSSMSERLSEMVVQADAFVVLPGGLGTLEEMFTVVSWAHLNIHQKPIGLINVNHFFDFLFVFLGEVASRGFFSRSVKEILLTANKADVLLDQLEAYRSRIDHNLPKLSWPDSSGKKRKWDFDLNRPFEE